MNYHTEQFGAGQPLLLLHGFSGSGADWEPFLPAFASHFHVLTVDLPGHGKADSPHDLTAYRMENTARDLIALLDSLHIEKTHLLGYSMGGRLALFLALTYPERFLSLILESASPGLQTEAERQARIVSDETLAAQIEQNGIEWFADYWANIPLFASQKSLPAEIQNRLREKRLANNTQGLANSLRAMGTGMQPSLWERLGELQIPVLLIAGERDIKFVTINQQMQPHIANAQLSIIPEAGHTVHLEQPEPFTNIVTQFLTSLNR
ncbi:MAG: 2-succinyl-6-hydroxy-2,4-cyclohexadiene-1-carboxylate synthase [bacterium]|nr:2-succinyl-6-hydroxy-2,4-cyclohexadiene-1-carboxylate synthase [bacterium]